MVQDRVGLAEVGADHAHRPAGVDERAAVQLDHRIVVDVQHPGGRVDLLDHVVGVPDRRQAGADVEELAHAELRDLLGRALVEAAVGPGRVPDLGCGRQDVLGGEAIDLEVVVAPEHVVVDPGGRRPARVYTRGNISLVHELASPSTPPLSQYCQFSVWHGACESRTATSGSPPCAESERNMSAPPRTPCSPTANSRVTLRLLTDGT